MDQGQFQAATGATGAQVADLDHYRLMLEEGNAVMNLVGPATIPDFWNRHALDSAQLLPLAPDARLWADLGAGAGLPGIVLAILLKDVPGAHVHLVESMAKRCRFLQRVCDDLALPASVHSVRAEDLALKVDVVTARACAPMVRLLDYAWPYLKAGATGLFLKGESVEAELQDAAASWKLDTVLHTSRSDPRGRVVELRRAARARR